jgi:hypothetical protein
MRMKGIVRPPSPAMAVALVALFVALSGTAFAVGSAIVPLAKRALTADNAKVANLAKEATVADSAKKLGTQNAAALVQQAVSQALAQASKAPGPASTAAGLVTVKTAPWSVGAGAGGEFVATCDAGQKAVAGGWEDPGGWGHPWDTRPTPDGTGWRTWVTVSSQAPGTQSGTVYAICLK